MSAEDNTQALFTELRRINTRPRPFEHYTARDLWANEHTSAQMLQKRHRPCATGSPPHSRLAS